MVQFLLKKEKTTAEGDSFRKQKKGTLKLHLAWAYPLSAVVCWKGPCPSLTNGAWLLDGPWFYHWLVGSQAPASVSSSVDLSKIQIIQGNRITSTVVIIIDDWLTDGFTRQVTFEFVRSVIIILFQSSVFRRFSFHFGCKFFKKINLHLDKAK